MKKRVEEKILYAISATPMYRKVETADRITYKQVSGPNKKKFELLNYGIIQKDGSVKHGPNPNAFYASQLKKVLGGEKDTVSKLRILDGQFEVTFDKRAFLDHLWENVANEHHTAFELAVGIEKLPNADITAIKEWIRERELNLHPNAKLKVRQTKKAPPKTSFTDVDEILADTTFRVGDVITALIAYNYITKEGAVLGTPAHIINGIVDYVESKYNSILDRTQQITVFRNLLCDKLRVARTTDQNYSKRRLSSSEHDEISAMLLKHIK